jgi:hypothetical protein
MLWLHLGLYATHDDDARMGAEEFLFYNFHFILFCQRPKDLGAMSPDDIKKIMAKGNRKSRRQGDKIKGSDE